MVNIKKISEVTGYSKSTISRFINKTGYVSENASQIIQQAITTLDYTPNSLARNLSKGVSSQIGVVIPHMSSPFFIQTISGIMEEAYLSEYSILILQSKYDKDEEYSYLEKLHSKELAALIFTSHSLTLEEILRYRKYGSIVVCEDVKNMPISSAFTSREKAYVKAFELIKHKGFKHIAIMLSRDYYSSVTSQLTIDCYEKVFGLIPEHSLISTNITTFEDGYAAGKKYANLIQKPDYIFANSDDVAAGVSQAYVEAGLHLPEMMGQENQVSGFLLNISTIDHHFKELGQAAFQLALKNDCDHIMINSEVMNRNL